MKQYNSKSKIESNPLPLVSIEELLAEWQKRLSLQDWELIASFKRAYEMPDKLGSIEFSHTKLRGEIKIMDPLDYCSEQEFNKGYDIEFILVHELLHIHTAFTPKPTEGWEECMEERAINSIAKALVNAKRGV